jgi:hypothetical protein
MTKKATAKNVGDVLRRFAQLIESEPLEQRRLYARDVNTMLDSIADQDAFGTEGQLDPRGDQRDS